MSLICKDCRGDVVIEPKVDGLHYRHKTYPLGFCKRKGRIKVLEVSEANKPFAKSLEGKNG